jgi:transcriptional regulator
MYQPPYFREERLGVLHDLIGTHPLATLVTVEKGRPDANHIPMLIDRDRGRLGVLRAHVARGNALARGHGGPALAIFQGPESYVTPSWYATKREAGKVVPTWNYVVVHAHGLLTVIDDPAWIREQIEALTRAQEDGRAEPWHVTDAPADFVASQVKAIVGIEIEIATLEGKWKVSQNRPAADRQGVAAGLRVLGGDAPAMAALVDEFGAAREAPDGRPSAAGPL